MLNFALVKDARRIAASRPRPASHYSYLGSDVPSRLPLLSPLPDIHISVEESICYTMDHPGSAGEWLWTATVKCALGRTGGSSPLCKRTSSTACALGWRRRTF